ncbi:MAG: hypothetical protein R3F38_14090 [Gammaproteobacteria bacterium]
MPPHLGVATEIRIQALVRPILRAECAIQLLARKKEHEVNLVAEVAGEIIPFEVKYRAQHGARELKV